MPWPGSQRHVLDDHRQSPSLPALARGYEVFVFDIRGSGENGRPARMSGSTSSCAVHISASSASRHGRWTTWSGSTCRRFSTTSAQDRARPGELGRPQPGRNADLPLPRAQLDPERIANFVGMGSTIILAQTPQTDMLAANGDLAALLSVASPGRLGRPMKYFHARMGRIDGSTTPTKTSIGRRSPVFTATRLRTPAPGAAPARSVSQVWPHALGRPAGSTTRRGWARSPRRR